MYTLDMHPQLENELLMHVAAGTDPLTALAALPCEDESSVKSSVEPSTKKSSGWFAVGVLVAVALLLLR